MLEFLPSGSFFTTFLVGLSTAFIVYWMKQKMKYNYPPGPWGLPVIGNMFQVCNRKLHKQVFEWSKMYGPLVTLRLGTQRFVFVNEINVALEVLVKKSTDFAARMLTPTLQSHVNEKSAICKVGEVFDYNRTAVIIIGAHNVNHGKDLWHGREIVANLIVMHQKVNVISYGGKDIGFNSYGPTWKLHRRISSKALRSYMQGNSLQKRVHSAVEATFEEIDKTSTPFDPAEYVNFMVGDIMHGLCFGGRSNFANGEWRFVFQRMIDFIEAFGIGTLEDAIPGLMYVYKTKAFRTIEQIVHDIGEDFIRKKLKQAEKTFDRDNIRHFTDDLLLAKLEAEEEDGKEALQSLSEDHLLQTIMDIFLAGIDTSRFTLTYAILHMVAFQDIQEKVQQEIDQVVGKERLPGIEDRQDLGYTEAVLHESMRLSTILPNGLTHMTACDTEVSGYRIPKGTAVVINHWALHHDAEAWKDVDRFIPERYLDENGKLGPKPKNWLPFSAGKRVCLGEFVAKPELHLLFASLMQRYKWAMESGKCPDLEPTGTSFFLQAKPFKVVAKKRI